MCDAAICLLRDSDFLALTVNEDMAARNVIDRISNVVVRIMFIPSYTTFRSRWRLFWYIQNLGDVF